MNFLRSTNSIGFRSTVFRFLSTKPSTATSTKTQENKGKSEYLAADMYDYTTFSHYDIEASMTKFRLPQPSASSPLKIDSAGQKK